MVLSAVREGEKIIVPRNVHKSVLMGLIMSGATPVYVMPEYLEPWNLWGSVTPEAIEEAFRREPEAARFFWLVRRITELPAIWNGSPESAAGTTRFSWWTKPMGLICISRTTCRKARLSAEPMRWRRVFTRRPAPSRRVPCSIWEPTGWTAKGWRKTFISCRVLRHLIC